MGLLAGTIPAQANADNVITYDGNTYDSSASGEKWSRVTAKCTTITWNASTTFTSSTNKPYKNGSTLYYIAKPSDGTISISASSGTQLYAWSVSGDDTTISNANDYKTFTIATPDYTNAFNKKVWEFDYTDSGHIQEWAAPEEGTYKLEVWGAQGGGNATYYGGYGGYSVGDTDLTAGTTSYIIVGGQGTLKSDINGTTPGGYNGGGYGFGADSNDYGAGGGGATHISTTSSLLSARSGDYSTTVYIVAGGGGAGMPFDDGYKAIGGHGGGYIGGNGAAGKTDSGNSDTSSTSSFPGIGGDQTKGGKNSAAVNSTYVGYGSFGQGGQHNYRINNTLYPGSNMNIYSWHGGGGGFYGGSGSQRNGAGGGSGYINTNKLSNASMYGYGVSTSTATATKTYSTSNVSSTATSQYAKTGNGYARITFVSE